MKDFVRPAGRLGALPFHARLTYSIFLFFTLVALAFTAWLGADMLAPDLHRLDEYYAGAAAISGGTHAGAASANGPQIDLPEDSAPAPDPIPLRKLLEVTHFHLFSMPVYLMILSHLFMLSTLSPRMKSWWIALGSLGVFTHIAAPWVARQGGAPAHAFYALSGTLLAASFSVMSAVPLWEMWRKRRA
ncbi:MAG TPA: hypothetical protein VHZ95_14265 [Polyangiales bacterium]|jgi:hypothetical protein|nr:hypothetical protein [Polyangiales bacterium]